MTLEWMKKQAPWVIGTFGVLILAGLILMDTAGNYSSDRQNNIVGTVNGEDLPTERFQNELKNYLRNQEGQSGKAPEGVQLAQMREVLFNYKVQSILLQKVFTDYQLYPSSEEMMDFVLKHPQEVAQNIARYRGYESMPPFLADSTLDQRLYENWLNQDSIYDRMSMRELEENLKSTVIPQIQLQQLMKSQVHRTTLEEAYTISVRENKAKIKFYHVALDSFSVSPDKYSEADLKKYFTANPDSFYFHNEAARLGYVRLAIKPSKSDSTLMFDFAKELKERIKSGEKFSDLAKDYSNEAASAEKGGKMEGLQAKANLEPSLANAAFTLNPGEVSEPVLTTQGYQVIELQSKKLVDTVEKVEISHILLKISAGTETIDSMLEVAEKLRAEAQTNGLAKAAEGFKVIYEKTPIFEKSNLSPLPQGYVQGANSFAFSQFESKEKISEALQADEAIYLFERDAKFAKGRDFDRAKSQISGILAKEEKMLNAQKELETQKGQITGAADAALPSTLGKAKLDSTTAGLISADNWLPGFGYAHPSLFKVFAQQPNSWGGVLNSEMGAVLAKVTEKTSLSISEIWDKAQAQLAQPDNYQSSNVFQEWITNLPKSAKVENKMDLVFRN